MIRSLRTTHLRVFIVLSIALALLFVAVMLVRRPAPITPRIPDALLKSGEAAR